MSEWKEFDEWFSAQYGNMLALEALEGGTAYKKFMAQILNTPGRFSGQMRMRAFVRLRFGYPLRHGGYSCVSLRVKTRTAETTFATCYLTPDTVEYVCASPTFDSRDGEYRHRFVRFEGFLNGYIALEKLLSEVEAKILTLIADNSIQIDSYVFPKEGADAARKLLERERVPLRILAASLLLDGGRIQQIHTTPEYESIINEITTGWPHLVELGTAGRKDKASNFLTKGGEGELRVECGQKIAPLTLREIMEPGNINFASWRESFARDIASNLIINGLTPSLHLSNQWMYIDGTDASLFTNKAMRMKFRRGDVANHSVARLREARNVIGPEIGDSHAAASYDAHVYEAIEVAQGHLLISGTTMCSTMENTGVTAASISRIVTESAHEHADFAQLLHEIDHMAKFAFDILNGASCLHTKAGIIHGDLHANNFTCHTFAAVYKGVRVDGKLTRQLIVEHPAVAYVAGPRGEADTYVFPYNGLVGCIIDYSRAIFGPGLRTEIVSEFDEDFARNFYRDQVTRAIRVLHRYAPSFVEKHQEAVKAAFLADFDAAFRCLTYVDFVAVGEALVHALTNHTPSDTDVREFRPAAACIDFARLIEKRSREHLVVALHDMVERKRTKSIPYAGEVLLGSLFATYKYSPMRADLKTATLCDVYNCNAPILWDGRDYATFPPWARLDKIEEKLNGVKIAEVLTRGVEPFLDSILPNPHVDIIAETTRAEQEALDRPASATSSWIE